MGGMRREYLDPVLDTVVFLYPGNQVHLPTSHNDLRKDSDAVDCLHGVETTCVTMSI